MSELLQVQLKNSEELKKIIKQVEVAFSLSDGRTVETLLVYLPIDAGKSCHQELLRIIKENLLYNFVFSCTEVEKKLNLKSDNNSEELFKKAVRKISKKTAHGELGELILFTLLDIYFQAPKILSKVSLKSNSKMPVFGADAVHGQFVDGGFKLYLGESKLYTSFKSAVPKAVESIENAMSKYEEEFDLIDSYIDFPGISKALEEKLLDLLDPFSDKDIAATIHSPCLIGFADPKLIVDAKSENDFKKKYVELAEEHIADFFSKLEAKNVEIDEASLLLLPYSCVDSMVADFIKYVGV
ncbi:DUF1837 domain-containing protein [Marinobacter sp.]|uniref:HamA C-terminal domain-containing protein n=1 Tax=Marinobacter sp. TaxID=50741 RepID=UPI003A93F247